MVVVEEPAVEAGGTDSGLKGLEIHRENDTSAGLHVTEGVPFDTRRGGKCFTKPFNGQFGLRYDIVSVASNK
jgi:hypothetical protein